MALKKTIADHQVMHNEGAEMKRRKSDNCIAVRLWERGTPYIQMGGYAVLLGTLSFATYAAAEKVENFDTRIIANSDEIIVTREELKKAIAEQNAQDRAQTEKLDLVISLLKGRDNER